MRKSTLASMLILCGSTAAVASIGASPAPQSTNNSMTMNNMMSNDTMSNDATPDPMPANDMMPTPTPTPMPGAMNNEMAPKPM